MITISSRIHTYARPDAREKIIDFYTNILGCKMMIAPGTSMPAFLFSNGASLSVEFTDDALDEQQARRGAWLELKTDDSSGLKQKVLAAGLLQVEHPITKRFYFQAPGGQIWGIADS